MRIGIAGTFRMGKTTYIEDVIKNWKMYSTNYTPVFANMLTITEDDVLVMLNKACDDLIKSKKSDMVLFDGTVLDILVLTMWLNVKGKVSDSFVGNTIKIVRESLVFYDILFFFPITKHSPIDMTEYIPSFLEMRTSIDNLMKSVMYRYTKSDNVFFPVDHKLGCPAIIELYGKPEQRVGLTKLYLDDDGSSWGEKDSLVNKLMEPDAVKLLLQNTKK